MPRIKGKYLAVAALMLGFPAGSAEAAACSKQQTIKDAFGPSIAYQASRTKSAAGAQGIYDGYNGIESGDMGCRELYNQYDSYLNDVTTQTDRSLGVRKFGFTFRKW